MKNKISLSTAIMLNINIIIGSAFFVGAKSISENGLLGPLSWILFGLALLPLVIVLSKLTNKYPTAGGLFVYSKRNLGAFWGFVSGWGYYIGTIAGNAIIIHLFSRGIENIGLNTFLKPIGLTGLSLDIFFITLFTAINLFNINFLEKIQIIFTSLKAIPFIVIAIAAVALFSPSNLTAAPVSMVKLFETAPLVMFAYIGIESCCAIAHQIKNGAKNSSRAILFSFALIVGIYAIAQLGLLGILGPKTNTPFLELIPALTSNNLIIFWGNKLISFAIISSFLGGFYSMFYANNWNLFAIAKEKNIICDKQITKLNKNQIPYISVIIQGILTIAFLLMTQQTGHLIAMCNIGTVTAYTLSVVAFIVLYKKSTKFVALGIAALTSCSYFIFNNIQFLMKDGLGLIIPFFALLAAGLILYGVKHRENRII